jgi:hypothetical protein
VALRLPTAGGPLRAYLLPALTPAGWPMGRSSPARSAIGMDVPGRRLLYRDSTGDIDAFDLVAYRERPVDTLGGHSLIATVSSDGTLLAVSADGTVIESEPWGASEWPAKVGRGVRDAFAGVGSHLIVIRHAGGDSIAVASRETGVTLTAPVPDAAGRTATRDGDAVALATDSGLVVVEDREPQNPWFIRLKGSPVAVAFTPSGHRIYVALKSRSELAVVDRFQRSTRPPIPLPDPAGTLRMDPWGRAILVHAGAGAQGDDTWIVSIPAAKVSGHVRTQWASDLPTVSEGGVLLLREGQVVVARDLRSLDSLGAVDAGGGDLWFVGQWKPTTAPNPSRQEARAPALARARAAAAAASAAPRVGAGRRAAAAQPTAAGATPPAAEASPGRVWVQVSVSQNERASRELAAGLARGGQHAQVIEPRSPGEGWRVVVGPYPSRAAADSAGRLLGRAYYILERGLEGPARQ